MGMASTWLTTKNKGVSILYTILHFIFARVGGVLTSTDIPMLLVGYGFGASFVALFMQLGGGIYTKVNIACRLKIVPCKTSI